jgi:hypothetical protein
MQRANEDLNATLDTYKTNLDNAKIAQDAVKTGLTEAYTWLLLEREEFLKTGQVTQEQALLIDEQVKKMLVMFDQFAAQEDSAMNVNVAAGVKAYEDAVANIIATLGRLPETVWTTWHVIRVDEPGGGTTVIGHEGGGVRTRAMATGGVLTHAQRVIAGDVPEAIIPLSRLGQMGFGSQPTVIVNVAGSVTTEKGLVAAIRQGLRTTNRANAMVTV